MDRIGEGWGFCSEADSWFSGSYKSFAWAQADGLIGCAERVLAGLPGLGRVLMPLLPRHEGGYRNRPIKSWTARDPF